MIFSFGIDKGADKVYSLCIQRILNVPQEKSHAVRTSQNRIMFPSCRDALLGFALGGRCDAEYRIRAGTTAGRLS